MMKFHFRNSSEEGESEEDDCWWWSFTYKNGFSFSSNIKTSRNNSEEDESEEDESKVDDSEESKQSNPRKQEVIPTTDF